jgi:hypothetical protein
MSGTSNYHMDDEKWNGANMERLVAFMASDFGTEKLGVLKNSIQTNIDTGTLMPDNRKHFWSAICQLCATLGDHNPIGRGTPTNIDPVIDNDAKAFVADVTQEIATLSPKAQQAINSFGRAGSDLQNGKEGALASMLYARFIGYYRAREDNTKTRWLGKTNKNGTLAIEQPVVEVAPQEGA